jgi:Ca2+-binding EF-hand superfamily protein
MTDDKIDELIKGVDTNNDGQIDYKEFIMMMQAATKLKNDQEPIEEN